MKIAQKVKKCAILFGFNKVRVCVCVCSGMECIYIKLHKSAKSVQIAQKCNKCVKVISLFCNVLKINYLFHLL